MLDGHAQGKTARLPCVTELNASMSRGVSECHLNSLLSEKLGQSEEDEDANAQSSAYVRRVVGS